MLTNLNPSYTQWNTDVNGNPISVHKQEMQQVSPVYFNIQLDEIPDSFHRLSVKDTEGNTFYEVDNFARISEQSYYVDYNNGIVYFHHTKGATVVNVTYYGRGFKLIRSSRIVMEDGTNLTEAIAQSQTQVARTSIQEDADTISLQEQIDTVCKFVRKQQRVIEMLAEELESVKQKLEERGV